MRGTLRILPLLMACASSPPSDADPVIRIGSKAFTESVILGEVAAQLIAAHGRSVEHRRQLGGTRILWSALQRGDIDLYPEYTGTLRQEILAAADVADDEQLRQRLQQTGIMMSAPLGFNNTYALGMRRDTARRHGISTISDLVSRPQLRLGFSNEFMDRADGWRGLKSHYQLPHRDVRGLDHDLAYRGLAGGSVDVTDLYSTDAEIAYYRLQLLDDDRRFFPEYRALFVIRRSAVERDPGLLDLLNRLGQRLPDATMASLNARAKLDRTPETEVAADFLRAALSLERPAPEPPSALLQHTREHLVLVGISLGMAILIAIPLGVLAARWPRLGQVILGVTGIIQTIPALALLVFMIPLLGIGGPPAVVALFLYSLLPIVRNTCAGLQDIAAPVRESAIAIGLTPAERLRFVELPIASRSILAGVKTSAVINIGTATLGALIGAGGYGQPILTGIRLDDVGLILQGAVPAALMALVAQGLFELAERYAVPRGLRCVPTE